MPFLGTTGGASVKQYGGQANLGYFIKNSVRLRSSAGGYITRTPASSTNRQTWTYSTWLKRSDVSSGDQTIIAARADDNNRLFFHFLSSGAAELYVNISGTAYSVGTTAVFRDPSAWYHLVIATDTTQSTDTNRIKFYINGVQQTLTVTTNGWIPQNTNTQWNNNGVIHTIAKKDTSATYSDCYLAETYGIDGQQLTPSSFGKTDAATGQWIPKKFASTYGTNGFYLNYADKSAATAAAIGKDSSPNGNNWTPNNISVTSGATYDAMIDSPSLSAAASNYCTWNPLFRFSNSSSYVGTFSDGNLKVATGGNPTQFAGTMELFDGAYYEVTAVSIDSARSYIGLFSPSLSTLAIGNNIAYEGTYSVLYSRDGGIWVNTTTGGNQPLTGSSWTNGDVISVAYKSGKIYFARNGVWQNSGVPESGTGFVASGWDSYGALLPYCGYNSTFSANFGQQPFTHTPPSGFKALNAFNLS